ncbi:MAG: response regulator, partial [Bacteroidota bacterium]
TAKNEEINQKNEEIKEKNDNLDQLNGKLVAEMAERESIEESSFARDRFLATMSHEMRTPMNAIIGLTHLLLKENPRADQVESLRTLQFSANNMTVFINDVLDFSKIEAGKLILENREFEPKQIFDDIHERFIGVVGNKGLVFNYDYDRKIPNKLLGDPARLNQILTNLVSNALNLTDKGFINLSVKLHEYKKQEAVVFISVTDSGDGMTTEVLDKMFKKYGPGSDDNFEGYDASGLGLAITKRFVDLQNGLIEVHSEPGQGTSFRLFLPFKIVEEEVAPVTNDKGELTFDHLAGNKVLIVEDNKINQLVVAKILRKLGIEAVTCDNGQEGVEMVQKFDFDLVLMDIQMPVMDGYRATAEIRKLSDPKKADTPIIALTASAFLSEKEKAKLFGMNDHIGKPFGPEELLEKISVALQPKVIK